MESIEIFINNLWQHRDLFIDVKNNIVKINNNEKKIDPLLIEQLIRTIRTWDSEYYNSKIIDAEEFIIKVKTSDGTDIIKGKGSYPKNYNTFKEIIGELYE